MQDDTNTKLFVYFTNIAVSIREKWLLNLPLIPTVSCDENEIIYESHVFFIRLTSTSNDIGFGVIIIFTKFWPVLA